MSNPRLRLVGGGLCPCVVTVSHTNPLPLFLVLSLSCRPPPAYTQAPALHECTCYGQGSSLRWGRPGHTLTTAVLYGFLCSYNQRCQAGERLRQLQEGMLQRTEGVEVKKNVWRFMLAASKDLPGAAPWQSLCGPHPSPDSG